MTGPVSTSLTQELLQEIRRQGILIWLDKDAAYSQFVDQLAGQYAAGTFPFPVVGFRGSFLETLFALEAYGSGYEKHSLVVHMPGFNEEAIKCTPLLELYSAGTRFRKSLDTLIRQAATGRVLPKDVEEFLGGKPSLEKADEWLQQTVSNRTVGLAGLLEANGPSLVLDALGVKNSVLAERVSTAEDASVLRSYLHTLTGMDDAWVKDQDRDSHETPLAWVLRKLAAWILCVEYVNDLRREPFMGDLKPLRSLSKPLQNASKDLVEKFRNNYPDAYAQMADGTESDLDVELKAMSPEDLGYIDTFREEENRVLGGAVEALQNQEWDKALSWAKAREGEKSFWLQRDAARRRTWNLVTEAATFGRILSENPRPFEKITSHDDAISRYAQSAARVDRSHRRFEQEWIRRLDTQMPYFGQLKEVLDSLRQLQRKWVDQLCRDFSKLCKDTGFLPPAELQQRNLFEQVVVPIAAGGDKVAVFLIDAFRYELATELLDDLRAAGGGAILDLKARYAELPTITSVGMNALPPVAQNGRLVATTGFKGFRTGEYTVRKPDDRSRAMGVRVNGKPGLHVTLSALCDDASKTLSNLKNHQVVVVSVSEIDDAGEANVGLLTFETQLRQIKAAWHHLQAAGVKHAVFTADHGFLLQDSTTQHRVFGKKTDPQKRYILSDYEQGESGIVPIALCKLGYDEVTGFLLLSEDSAVFATPAVSSSFVHGGNSPQERIIPVLTVTRKRAETGSLADYAVEAKVMSDAFGFHRIQIRLGLAQNGQSSLGFAGARSIDLDLRVPERKDIRVLVKEVSGSGTLKAGRVNSPVGDVWTEIFFALLGPTDDRVQVEVYHADKIEKVVSAIPDTLYSVAGETSGKTGKTIPPPPSTSWAENIEEDGPRTVFLHIEKHGSITESELTVMLGNGREARKFARYFDIYLAKLPFKVRCESMASGKRYVLEEEN